MQSKADVNEMIDIFSITTGGMKPYNFTWDLGDGIYMYEENISHAYYYPGDYLVRLTVKDSEQNIVHASKTILIVDEIPPEIYIIAPENALYLFNNKLFALQTPIIFGDIDILFDVTDNVGISNVILSVNNEEKYNFTQFPLEWTWEEKMFGKATIDLVAYDISGNKANDAIIVWKFF
jgi:hypothetical protein